MKTPQEIAAGLTAPQWEALRTIAASANGTTRADERSTPALAGQRLVIDSRSWEGCFSVTGLGRAVLEAAS